MTYITKLKSLLFVEKNDLYLHPNLIGLSNNELGSYEVYINYNE